MIAHCTAASLVSENKVKFPSLCRCLVLIILYADSLSSRFSRFGITNCDIFVISVSCCVVCVCVCVCVCSCLLRPRKKITCPWYSLLYSRKGKQMADLCCAVLWCVVVWYFREDLLLVRRSRLLVMLNTSSRSNCLYDSFLILCAVLFCSLFLALLCSALLSLTNDRYLDSLGLRLCFRLLVKRWEFLRPLTTTKPLEGLSLVVTLFPHR